MFTVRFKPLYKDVKLPAYATDGSAGLDIYAHELEFINASTIKYSMGWAVEIPPGYFGLITPRSSIVKRHMRLANTVGIIDSDYRGEVTAIFIGNSTYWKPYYLDERIAQMLILPYPKIEVVHAEQLNDTKRGEGGYGSTGK
jgi:dUTP pyrophosphatase